MKASTRSTGSIPGRERILFAPERDVHEGILTAYGVPSLPPTVRVAAAQGDPRARKSTIELRELPGTRPRQQG